ncbi:MAG: hypothetical protein DCC67_02460, partial [Planctomycetota bacterium]
MRRVQRSAKRRDGVAGARRGLTLVELAITVLVIGILTASAAPKFAEALRRIRIDAACRRIKADLTLARQTAMSKSATQSVQFTANSGTYSLPGMAALDRPAAAYSVDLSVAPYQVRVSSALLGADSQVIFDRFGQPDSGGVITVASGSAAGTVTVDGNTGLAS